LVRQQVTDVTVIATAAISGGVGVAAAAIGALASTRVTAAEARREESRLAETRRAERRETYQTAIDLLTDYGWRSTSPSASVLPWPRRAQYDVIREFTIPFVRAANRIRLYCSEPSIAAIDQIQEGFALLNAANTNADFDNAYAQIHSGHDLLVRAAREDVGPRPEDRLRAAPHRVGAGPPA
jgi:hypothetical protein